MLAPISKHDNYVEELQKQLSGRYDHMYKGLPLHSKKGRLVGEIDLLGIGPHGVDIFEVKCSHRVTKARKQLTKIKKIFGSELDKQVNTWFYCGEAGLLKQIS